MNDLEQGQNLQAYYDAQCLTFFSNGEANLEEKLDHLISFLAQVRNDLSLLTQEKSASLALQAQLTDAQWVRLSVEANGKKSQQLYFLDLVQSIKNFSRFFEKLNFTQQDDLATRIQQLTQPSVGRRMKDAVQWVTSWLVLPFALIGRNLELPALGPDTLDSESKRRLQEIAQERIHTLSQLIREQAGNFTLRITPLASIDCPRLKQHLRTSTEANLRATQARINLLHELFVGIKTQCISIKANQAKLQALEQINPELQAFIEKNNGFLVKLSLLLSKICSIFKSKTAKNVEEFRRVQRDFAQLKTDCSQTIQEQQSLIYNNQHLAPSLKDTFMLALAPPTEVKPKSFPQKIDAANLRSQVLHVKTLFNGPAVHAATEANATYVPQA
jgi:hypothetical protein